MKTFFSNPLRVAILLILGLVTMHALLWIGHMVLPGFAGELCGKIQGLAMTPFFLEGFMAAFGLLSVLAINHFRQKWDGDEFVTIEVDSDE